jgi:ABC-type molybdenum transport system ATPase subunit/photorepair protein PhrA
MSDVHREQINDSKQSQMEASDMLVVSGLGVTSQNKTILEDVSFKAKRGTSLAIVGPNGGGKTETQVINSLACKLIKIPW